MNRRDDISNLYNQSSVLQKMATAFFWLNILAGLIPLFPKLPDIITKWLPLIQGLSALFFLVLSIADNCFCWYEAESQRRRYDIENAFGVRLGEYEVEGYYNNTLPKSMGKYAVNALESTYYTKEIVQDMLPLMSLKALFVIALLIIAAYVVKDKNNLAVIMQAIFTAYFIEDAVELYRYHALVKNIYNSLYKAFVTVGVTNREQEISAFADALEYESIKPYFKIRLDSKSFSKLNPSLSTQWNEIASRIQYGIRNE